MVDKRSEIAGQFGVGFPLTAILEEGAITVTENAYNRSGLKEKVATLGAPIAVDDLVYLIPGTKNTYPTTSGLPVVAKMAAGTFYTGIVTSTPEWVKMPTVSMSFTDCDNTDWENILNGGNYRVATVEFFGIGGAMEVDVKCDGSNDVAIGAPDDLKFDVSEGKYVPVSSGGKGLLPMHYVPVSSSGDLHTILVGVLEGGIVAKA